MFGWLIPTAALAASDPAADNCSNFLTQFNNGAFDWMKGRPEFCTIQGFMLWALRNSLAFAGTIAVLFIIYGGYLYLTSGGNEESAEQGRKTMVNSVIGLVVIIMSYVIVRVVTNLLTSGK